MFRRYAFWLLTVWMVASLVSVSEAAVGKFSYVEGKVDILRGGLLPATPVKTGDPVNMKDVVRTKSNSKAKISFIDGNTVMLAERTRIDINKYVTDAGKDKRIIKLSRGKLRSVVRFFRKTSDMIRKVSARIGTSDFKVHTPTAVIGVRGTDFLVSHTRNVTAVFVKKGNVYIFNHDFPDRVINVPERHYTTVQARALPKKSRPATEAMIKKIEVETSTKEPEGEAEQEAEVEAEQEAGGEAEQKTVDDPIQEAQGEVSVEEMMVETEEAVVPTEEISVSETIETSGIVNESGSGTSTDTNIAPPITETQPDTLKTTVTVGVEFQ